MTLPVPEEGSLERVTVTSRCLSLGRKGNLTAIGALRQSVEDVSLRNSVLNAIESGLANTPGAHVAEVRLDDENGRRVAFAVVRAPAPFTAEMVARLDDEIERATGRNLSLHLRTVLVNEMTRDGPAFQTRRSETTVLR